MKNFQRRLKKTNKKSLKNAYENKKNTDCFIIYNSSFCKFICAKQTILSATKVGYKRVDLIFPKIENSDQYKVEVRFGMETELYPCSNASFNFNHDALVKGYGIHDNRFPYYDLSTNKASVFEGFMNEDCKKEKKIKRKILSSNSLFLEYNSYYPIPFYIPESYTVEYRLWNTVTNEFTTVVN